MIYVDTSVIVALLTLEPSSKSVVTWFSEVNEPLFSSDWLLTEFSSAISIKVRTKQLSEANAKLVREAFDTLASGGLRLTDVNRSAFQAAATMAANHQNRLRSGDSLHLAIAQALGANSIATLDKNMAQNAERMAFQIVQFH